MNQFWILSRSVHLLFILLLLIPGLFAIAGCCGGLADERIESLDRTVFPEHVWHRTYPAEHGINDGNVEAAIQHIEQITGELGASKVVLVRNGYVIWQGEDAEVMTSVWSCTKSFMSSVLGLLWDDGLLEPGDLAAKFEPGLETQYPEVTLEHLGTFTSGLDYEEGGLEPKSPRFPVGEAFHYSSESNLLAKILTRVAERPIAEVFRQRIAGPIGIDDASMTWGQVGEVDGLAINGGSGPPPGGIRINALAMARFGWLMANEGVWDGERLLSQRYVDYATRPRTSPSTPPFDPQGWYVSLPGNYGLNWWTNGPQPDGSLRWPSAPRGMFAAQGNRDSVCFIIPEWDMVLVRLGEDKVIEMSEYDKVFELLNPAHQHMNQPSSP